MELYEYSVSALKKMLQNKKVSSREVTEAFLDRIEIIDGKVQAYITKTAEEALKKADEIDSKRQKGEELPSLAGIPMALKDNLCTKDIKTTCASKNLYNFKPPYSATVVEKLEKNGAVMLGKLNMDEFAMGSSCENSRFFSTRNPWDLERVPGGSSGGSAAAVAAREASYTLGSDTGGSIRQPASFCGVVGLKPTYGRVSRYGLVAFASSLDQIGPFANTVEDVALVLQAIAGHDPMDSTSVDIPVPDYSEALQGDIKGMKIGIPREYFPDELSSDVKDVVQKGIKKLEDLGAIVEECSMPHTEYALPTYYIVAPAEASSNLARYDGVRYGYRDKDAKNVLEMFMKTRNEGFGEEVKRRIMIGTYALSSGYYDAYYLKALKVRTLIRRDFESAFEKYDCLVSPTSPSVAFKLGDRVDDPLAMYLSDLFTVPANMAGIPAISLPCGFSEGLPVGMQIMGKAFAEETILKVAHAFEKNSDFQGQKPRGVE